MYSMWTKVIPFPTSSLYISYKTTYFHNILMKSFLTTLADLHEIFTFKTVPEMRASQRLDRKKIFGQVKIWSHWSKCHNGGPNIL